MIRRLRAATALALVLACVPAAASAAPSERVIQGEILRLVSVADWDAATTLVPGEPVRWDIEVSADAPDPSTVRVQISAAGDAPLRLDITSCDLPWADDDTCPGSPDVLRTAWDLPRDGAAIDLTRFPTSETAHLRLSLALTEPSTAVTQITVVAHTAQESVSVSPTDPPPTGGGDLATTGGAAPAALAVGAAALTALGLALALRRRREEDEG